ncbi:MAG: potassium channel protein [Bacteroidales bacterium]|nr:potassium channel protein [Bacteroidales bacterium]MBN2819136.1 potassium channel protein [Bacteroidales bacterium]
MNRDTFRDAYIALGLLLAIITIGIFGYMIIEGFNVTDAAFMTIITIATVGFKEVHPLSTAGMYFTIFLIITSFGIFAYAVSTLTRYVIGGAIGHYYKNRKVRNKINQLKDHVIVCGYGRNGRQAVAELLDHNVPLVIIESEPDSIEKILENPDLLYIHGDATKDEVLSASQAEKAKALISALPVDADNLFVVLTARELNPDMIIISRATNEHSDVKLKRAGANNVIMPDRIGGQRMAKLVAQPDVVEFLDYIMLQSSENVALEEVSCSKLNSYFEGKSIRELDIRNESGANIIGLKRSDKSFIINPLPEIQLSSLDKLFVLGTQQQVERLKRIMAEGKEVFS